MHAPEHAQRRTPVAAPARRLAAPSPFAPAGASGSRQAPASGTSALVPVQAWTWLLAAVLGIRLALMAVVPMADTSEPRYAEIARWMAQTGDWITPWFEPGVPFWGKPPLAFWASALSFRLFGVSDFAARLPAWLASLATLWLVFAFARSQYGSRVARIATLIQASCLLTFVTAGAVLTDPYLALAITLCLVSYASLGQDSRLRWRYGVFVGLAMGLLAKGPLTIVLVLAVLVPWTLWHRQGLTHVRQLPWVTGLALTALLTLPWYVAAELKTPGFLHYFIVGEHFLRFIDPGWQGDLYGSAHQRPYGRIWLDWLLATFPWSFVALWQLARHSRNGTGLWQPLRRTADPRTSFLLLWGLVTPCFFTMSGNILWTYVLPSLPPFAILLAAGLCRRTGAAQDSRRWRAAIALVPAAGVLAAAAILVNPSLLKTEKALVQYHAAHAQAGQPLFYLDHRPFSARYYSSATAGLVRGQALSETLNQHPDGVYLALEPDALNRLHEFQVSPILFRNRRHQLVFVRKPAAPSTTPRDAQ